jgi:hypothetical protein
MTSLARSGKTIKALVWFYVGQAVRHAPIGYGSRRINYGLRWLERCDGLIAIVSEPRSRSEVDPDAVRKTASILRFGARV